MCAAACQRRTFVFLSNIHFDPQICPRTASELARHIVFLTILTCGFEVDSEFQQGILLDFRQVGLFSVSNLRTEIQLPAVEVVFDRRDNLYKFLNQ